MRLTEIPEDSRNNAIHTLAHIYYEAKDLAQRVRDKDPETSAEEAAAEVRVMIRSLESVGRNLSEDGKTR